jgi:hypothetical protein
MVGMVGVVGVVVVKGVVVGAFEGMVVGVVVKQLARVLPVLCCKTQ